MLNNAWYAGDAENFDDEYFKSSDVLLHVVALCMLLLPFLKSSVTLQ